MGHLRRALLKVTQITLRTCYYYYYYYYYYYNLLLGLMPLKVRRVILRHLQNITTKLEKKSKDPEFTEKADMEKQKADMEKA